MAKYECYETIDNIVVAQNITGFMSDFNGIWYMNGVNIDEVCISLSSGKYIGDDFYFEYRDGGVSFNDTFAGYMLRFMTKPVGFKFIYVNDSEIEIKSYFNVFSKIINPPKSLKYTMLKTSDPDVYTRKSVSFGVDHEYKLTRIINERGEYTPHYQAYLAQDMSQIKTNVPRKIDTITAPISVLLLMAYGFYVSLKTRLHRLVKFKGQKRQ